jgi:F-box-like
MTITAALTTLPNELLHDITELLDRESLLNCVLTSRRLAEIVAPKLWSVIPRLSPKKTVKLVQALAGSPNAAAKVLEVSISGPFRRKVSAPRLPTFHERITSISRGLGSLLWSSKPQSSTSIIFVAAGSELTADTFSTAFQNMIHLRILVIHGPVHPKVWGFTLFIPTLREIFVHRYAESNELLDWIKGQSNLTALRLWIPRWWLRGGFSLFNTGPILFRHLNSLTTTPHGVTNVLQISSVSDLIIEDNDPAQMGNAHKLAEAVVKGNASGSLKRLTLTGHRNDVLNLLVLLQNRLPDLRLLRVVFTNYSTYDFPPNVRDFLVALLPLD